MLILLFLTANNHPDTMPRRLRSSFKQFLFISLFFFLCHPVLGQSLFGNWFPERAISLEYNHPVFQKNSSFTAFNAYSFLNLNWQINDKVEFVGDLPWIYSNSSDSAGTVTSYTIGNPYVGLQLRKPLSLIFFEFGLRFPVTHIYPLDVRMADDNLLNRSGAFLDHTWSLRSDVDFHYEYVTGFSIRLRAGPRFLIPEKKGNPSFILDYSAQIRFKTPLITIGSGYMGALNATKSINTSIHQIVFEAMMNGNVFTPEIRVYLPYQPKGKPAVRYIVGLGLKMVIDNF